MNKRTFNQRVSCLMVAQESRALMARRAIKAFIQQTWKDKDLVVVTEGYWNPDLSGVEKVQLISIPLLRDITLGDLRNLGTARCRGDFVAQWDDDDVSHPKRLETMMISALDSPEYDGVYLSEHTGAWPAQDRYWISHRRQWECTTLLKRHIIPVYPSLRKGEDTPTMKYLNLKAIDNAPELYIRTFHGNNTWGEAHLAEHWIRKQRECTTDEKTQIAWLLGHP